MVYCNACSRNVSGDRSNDGPLCCNFCGKVLEEYNFSCEPQFVKDAAGRSKLSGNFIRSVRDISDSRRRTLDKAYDEMRCMKDALSIDDYSDDVVDTASRFYEIALERRFTMGRRSELVYAACLYLACRQKKKPYLLIDFSSYLSVNVYEVGSVYLQLCYVLYLAETKDLQKLIDPSIFIHKFTNALIPKDNDQVVKTARDILASMKRDWMQTGRKPSGLCGAALYISALSHGLKISKSEIIKVVHICEATLTKRLIEFENTDSGNLTIEELVEKERDLRTNSLTKRPPNLVSKEAGVQEMLCKHMSKRPFAYGLCDECYEEFVNVSGGLEGGSDPPAFQRAEKERMLKSSVEDNANLESAIPAANIDSASNQEGINKSDKDNVSEVDGRGDESDNLSDIDDDEVDGYIHNEEEKRFKTIIWEKVNWEYLEEQAAKEAAAAAAKKAEMTNLDNCPEELREFAAAAAAVAEKSRKERQQKRAAEAKNSGPAETAAQAARGMFTKKRLSSKINYDALDKLLDVNIPEMPVKKQKIESDSDEKKVRVSELGKEVDVGYGEEVGNGMGDIAYAEEEGYGMQTFDNDAAYDYESDYGYDGF